MHAMRVIRDLDEDPDGNVQHIVEHDLSKEEVEEVFRCADEIEASRSTGRPIVFGETSTGRIFAAIFEVVDQFSIYPVTAYELDA